MADIKTPTPLDLAQMNEDEKAAKMDKPAGKGLAGNEGTATEQVDETTEDTADESTEGDKVDDNTDMFPRSYVEKLRKESANYRERAKAADELAERLHVELVRADGRLADPADLPFDAKHLDDPAALDAAIAELVKAKPGLRARHFSGTAGQGSTAKPTKPRVNLIDLMRG